MQERQQTLRHEAFGQGPVVVWLDRDMRAVDHWGLCLAQKEAMLRQKPLVAVAFLKGEAPVLPRSACFRLHGMLETAAQLRQKNVPLFLLPEHRAEALILWLRDVRAAALYCDFSPLRSARQMRNELANSVAFPVVEVDNHNVVPCWLAMDKKAYAAHHFRRAVQRQLNHFLCDMPSLQRHPDDWHLPPRLARSFAQHETEKRIEDQMTAVRSGDIWQSGTAGTTAGMKRLARFLQEDLPGYEQRNDPNQRVTSRLSPWLHFGQVSPQRVAFETRRHADTHEGPSQAAASFLEQLIIRRELADNFCFYNPDYDRLEGFPDWAQQTLQEHQQDPRPRLFDPSQLDAAKTDDPIWNAAQSEMVLTGQMPGYLRMYWAKKLLEWLPSPQQALQIAIDLNDRHSLDGRDPNGYVGIAWSIGGVHDRPFASRLVSGKIRPMTASGCRRKFDVPQYLKRVKALREEGHHA